MSDIYLDKQTVMHILDETESKCISEVELNEYEENSKNRLSFVAVIINQIIFILKTTIWRMKI